jgi:hypothetical protein
MKKTFAIVGANLLIAGGLSARATWMIMSGCDINGTCRGSSGLLTWGLAVGPALLLLVVLGLSVPKMLAGLSVRREERKVMKAERAEVAVQQSQETEQGQSRLAKLRKTAVSQAELIEAEGMGNGPLPDEYDLQLDEIEADDAIRVDADDVFPVVNEVASLDELDTISVAEGTRLVDEDADAIEREWLAVEAERNPADDHNIAERNVDAPSIDLPTGYVPTLTPASFEDYSVVESLIDDAEFEYRIVPAVVPAATGDDQPVNFSTFDPAAAAAEEEAVAEETAAWFIEPADTTNRALQANGQSWRPESDETMSTGSGNPKVDIWARTAFDIGSDDDETIDTPAALRLDALAIEAPAEDLAPIELPVIGRATDEWMWLFADGLPLLRTSRATGFPWIAGGIGEVATAIQSAVNLDTVGHFGAEAEAWVRIARSIPYAEALPLDDAQAFVEWCNSLSVDLAATNQQDALCNAISDAMYMLRGRAKNDMETSLALPDAFDTSIGGGAFGSSLSA